VSDISIEELRENFDFYDKDGDGKLDREEFAGLMETLGMVEPGENPSRGFSAIDTDSSGQIEFDEFVAWFSDR
jgi:Ca2+-binding EF-hand superfamily protein